MARGVGSSSHAPPRAGARWATTVRLSMPAPAGVLSVVGRDYLLVTHEKALELAFECLAAVFA